jgi:twinkle protein
MYYLRFFGSTDVDEVLDAMEYAVYVYDVQHIILDNLQFMMTAAAGNSRGFERFDAQERALDKFRHFASNKNVHLTIVIHPRCFAAVVECALDHSDTPEVLCCCC